MQPRGNTTAVVPMESALAGKAAALAERLLLPLAEARSETYRFLLQVHSGRLALKDQGQPGTRALWLDPARRRTVPGGRDLIARALGRHCCTIIDATAGFGFDAFDFAHRGKRVVAIERSTVVAELLADAVPRFLSCQPNAGLSVITGDSRYLLTTLPPADVVFLDPMFPSHQQKSARSCKAQLMLRALVGDDNDAAMLARLARERALKRVVVKRPRHAPALGGPPDLTYAGRAVRYDVYLAGNS